LQYELRVDLRAVRPPIWRTLKAPGNLTLHRLHEVLQVVMGWEDAHLYLFQVGRQLYGEASAEWDMPVANAMATTLAEICARTSTFTYEYDLGDSWVHEITVEEVPGAGGADKLQCTDGARACPPEDCGGPPGYEGFLEAITDPNHEEHESLLEWIGGGFDPEAFDVATVNQVLSRL
jgi:hypothetical protein